MNAYPPAVSCGAEVVAREVRTRVHREHDDVGIAAGAADRGRRVSGKPSAAAWSTSSRRTAGSIAR